MPSRNRELLPTLGIYALWPAARLGMQEAEDAPIGGLRSVVQRGAALRVSQAGVNARSQQQRGH